MENMTHARSLYFKRIDILSISVLLLFLDQPASRDDVNASYIGFQTREDFGGFIGLKAFHNAGMTSFSVLGSDEMFRLVGFTR